MFRRDPHFPIRDPIFPFDLKAFHDGILNGGAMPLDLLQERVETWVKQQKS